MKGQEEKRGMGQHQGREILIRTMTIAATN